MKDLFTLENKTALVTGGSMGIGAMIAEGFLHFGVRSTLYLKEKKHLRPNNLSFQRSDHVSIFKLIYQIYQVLKNWFNNLAKKNHN